MLDDDLRRMAELDERIAELTAERNHLLNWILLARNADNYDSFDR